MKQTLALIITLLFTTAHSIDLNASAFTSPCEIISIDIINKVFHLENVTVENKPSGSSYPTCWYVWDGNLMQKMDAGGQKIDVEIECTVMITIVEQKVSFSAYEGSLKSYNGNYEKVDLYENAIWSDKRKQLTVYINSRIFHVNVNVNKDMEINKKNAIELSKIIVEKL